MLCIFEIEMAEDVTVIISEKTLTLLSDFYLYVDSEISVISSTADHFLSTPCWHLTFDIFSFFSSSLYQTFHLFPLALPIFSFSLCNAPFIQLYLPHNIEARSTATVSSTFSASLKVKIAIQASSVESTVCWACCGSYQSP